MIGPQIQVMARVTHKHIEEATYFYKGPAIAGWNQNCQLALVIKAI